MRVLVTGATGGIGRPLVRELLTSGVDVRAMTRAPADADLPPRVEIVQGSPRDGSTFRRALDGVDCVFLNLFGPPDDAAKALEAAGPRRAVLLSSITAGTRPGLAHADEFRALESTVVQAAPQTVVLRPGAFMSNLLWWLPELRRGSTVATMFADVAVPFIAPEDIASVAARLLVAPHVKPGSVVPLLGPELLTPRDQAAALSAVLGRVITVEPVDVDAYGRRHPDLTRDLLEYLVATFGSPSTQETTPSDLESLLGRPPIRLLDWLRMHRTAFPS